MGSYLCGECDLQQMISSMEFRPISNKFLTKMNEDIKNISSTKELLIYADKSSNIYKMIKEDYKKHLVNNITKSYKKSNRNKSNSINRDAKKIAKKIRNRWQSEKIARNRSFYNDQRPQR